MVHVVGRFFSGVGMLLRGFGFWARRPGAMFLGLSYLSTKVHAVPFERGTPTVISQVGKLVYGGGALGHVR